jgi:hypothetical protein
LGDQSRKQPALLLPSPLAFSLVLFISLCSLCLSVCLCLSLCVSLCACLFFPLSLSPSLDLRSRDLIYIAHCWGCLYSRLYLLFLVFCARSIYNYRFVVVLGFWGTLVSLGFFLVLKSPQLCSSQSLLCCLNYSLLYVQFFCVCVPGSTKPTK